MNIRAALGFLVAGIIPAAALALLSPITDGNLVTAAGLIPTCCAFLAPLRCFSAY